MLVRKALTQAGYFNHALIKFILTYQEPNQHYIFSAKHCMGYFLACSYNFCIKKHVLAHGKSLVASVKLFEPILNQNSNIAKSSFGLILAYSDIFYIMNSMIASHKIFEPIQNQSKIKNIANSVAFRKFLAFSGILGIKNYVQKWGNSIVTLQN